MTKEKLKTLYITGKHDGSLRIINLVVIGTKWFELRKIVWNLRKMGEDCSAICGMELS